MRELSINSLELNKNNVKVLIAYKSINKFNDALTHQNELHKKGIVSIIEYEPCQSKESATDLLRANRCTELKWID